MNKHFASNQNNKSFPGTCSRLLLVCYVGSVRSLVLRYIVDIYNLLWQPNKQLCCPPGGNYKDDVRHSVKE